MNKKTFLSLIIFMAVSAFISSCKKDDDDNEPTPVLDSQAKQFNDDSNNYKTESDQADDDINNSIKDIPGFGKFTGPQSSPICGCTIDSSQMAQKILFFNFDGVTPCFSPSRTRHGQIKAELIAGNMWSDAGAVLKLTYNNFKVVRMSDNASIKFNGVKTLKNINGNNWINFFLGASTLRYQARANNVQVEYSNGSLATWNLAHITQWSYTPSNQRITFTATGDTTLNGYSNVSNWGVNRFGQSFTSHYNSSINSNTYCGLWRPVSGQLVHHVNNTHYTITLGVDTQGNPSTLDCAYGFTISWPYNGSTATVILSY